MLKIDTTKRYKDFPPHIKEILEPNPIEGNKSIISGWTFFVLDFMYLMYLNPVPDIALGITLPFFMFINIWAITILVRKQEIIKFELLLFFGCLGIIGSFIFFIFYLSYSYLLGVWSVTFSIMCALIYFGLIYLFNLSKAKRYSTLDKTPKEHINTRNYTMVLGFSIAIGFFISHFFTEFPYSFSGSLLTISCYGISLAFINLLAKNFNKFIFMKKNIHFVRDKRKRSKSK